MSTTPFQNHYILRTVAESSSKACFVCHKATTRVLTTEGNKDFFYTCTSHLSDRGFASPIIDEKAEAEKRKQEELAKEKEAVIKEYEESMKKKGKAVKKDSGSAKTAEEEQDDKLRAIDVKATASAAAAASDGPREFTLHRNFYQMRLDRKTNIDKAKRDQQRINTAGFFPSAPLGGLK